MSCVLDDGNLDSEFTQSSEEKCAVAEAAYISAAVSPLKLESVRRLNSLREVLPVTAESFARGLCG